VLLWALGLTTLSLLVYDALWRHPGYAFGDETIQIHYLQQIRDGGPFHLRWAQGGISRGIQLAWCALGGGRLGWIYVPGLVFLLLECGFLHAVARRWYGAEVADWAVLACLGAAFTWLRSHSLLSRQFLPAEVLFFCWASAWVRSRASAVLWAAAAALLVLDYEGALIAMPLAAVACAVHEPGPRRHAGSAVLAGMGTLFLLMLLQPATVQSYVSLRTAVSWGEDLHRLAAAIWSNLHAVFLGSPETLPYMAVEKWPALAYWLWPGLALAALRAGRGPALAILAWAILAVLATQSSLAPYGAPVHRLVAAWPALCLLAGLGFSQLRQGLGRWGWLVLLWALLGFGLELHGYALHLGAAGDTAYGRSQSLDRALRDAVSLSRAEGDGVSTVLADQPFPVARFHLASLPAPQPKPGGAYIVLLSPDLRLPWLALHGERRLYQLDHSQEPVLWIRLRGAEAERFRRVDAELREALGPPGQEAAAQRERIESWQQSHPGADDFSWASLTARDAWLAFQLTVTEEQYRLACQRPLISPAPFAKLAEFYQRRDAHLSLALAQRSLDLDPLFRPAHAQYEQALGRLGCEEQAAEAKAVWRRLYDQGAWPIYF
jgi:hypothetical protein